MISTLIDGVLGETDKSLLDRTDGGLENDNEKITWIEYRLKSLGPESEPVHRSVHVHLKKNVVAESVAANF